jgi:hypothetical protein
MKGYHLFRANKAVEELDRKIQNNNVALEAQQKPARVTYLWSREVSLVVRALALTDQLLLAAGPRMDPADAGTQEPTFDSEAPAALMAFRVDDGSDQTELAIPSQPVFDGMALARGALFMSLTDGTVVCYDTR